MRRVVVPAVVVISSVLGAARARAQDVPTPPARPVSERADIVRPQPVVISSDPRPVTESMIRPEGLARLTDYQVSTNRFNTPFYNDFDNSIRFASEYGRSASVRDAGLENFREERLRLRSSDVLRELVARISAEYAVPEPARPEGEKDDTRKEPKDSTALPRDSVSPIPVRPPRLPYEPATEALPQGWDNRDFPTIHSGWCSGYDNWGSGYRRLSLTGWPRYGRTGSFYLPRFARYDFGWHPSYLYSYGSWDDCGLRSGLFGAYDSYFDYGAWSNDFYRIGPGYHQDACAEVIVNTIDDVEYRVRMRLPMNGAWSAEQLGRLLDAERQAEEAMVLVDEKGTELRFMATAIKRLRTRHCYL